MLPPVAFVRRLRAIAVIDIAGYSRMMATEEGRTHARVNALFSTVVNPAIDDHGGHQVERAGDGLLVLFESSTEAVRCALSIQRAAEEHESAIEAGRRLRMRIGINVGDIIIDGEEIAGDDVNIAARLQALAEPGTVCISSAVRDQLHEELDSTFEDLGNVVLKNIGRPVRVFQVRSRGRTRTLVRLWRPSRWRSMLMRHKVYALAGVAALALASVSLSTGWSVLRDPSGSEPPPMSVAVMPFKSRTPGEIPPQVLEVAESVTRGLAATGWIQVTAPDLVQHAAGRTPEMPALRASLNVRYAVLGRIGAQDGRLAVDVELIDIGKGSASWTGHVVAADRLGTATDLAMNLVVQLRDAIYDAEAKRLFESGAVARTPMEHKILGDFEHAHFLTLESESKARQHFQKALSVDPNFVPAMISLAYTLISELDLDPAARGPRLIDQVDALSKRAVSRDSASAPAWQLRSEALARQWLWEAALDASDRSLSLDPGRAFGHGQRASLLVRLGKPAEALAVADKALALAEQRSGYVLFQRCRALMALGEYRASVEACQKSISREEWWFQRAHLLSAYALLGESDRASAEKARLLELQPQMSVARVRVLRQSNVREFEQQFEAHFVRGLRLAGIAEGG